MEKNREKIRKLILCAFFAALTVVGAFIKIPVPVVPFTLQFLCTTLAGWLLGGKWGALSVALYIALGLLGIPIFAEGGGIGYVLRPSFGYLLGFCLGSYLTGVLARRGEATYGRLLVSGFVGLGAVYLLGMAYYYLICNYVIATPIAFGPLFYYCFLMAVPGDILLCFLGAGLARRLLPVLGRKETQKKRIQEETT